MGIDNDVWHIKIMIEKPKYVEAKLMVAQNEVRYLYQLAQRVEISESFTRLKLDPILGL